LLSARGEPAFAGVLGWPLERTLSPAMHNAAFRQLGIQCAYMAWRVPPDDLPAAIGGIRALGALGANVTMPHKETVVGLLDEVSLEAGAIGAVNTIQRRGERLVGHNTDVEGFRVFLESDAGFPARGCSALVLGAGGAARAVVRALDDMGAREIIVAARRVERASAVAALASSAAVSVWSGETVGVGDTDLIVNATPLGADGTDALPGVSFRPGQAVVDLVYVPAATQLVRRAQEAGAAAWGGLGMLVHQAAASFRLWTGQDAPLETMSAAALGAAFGPPDFG
jgi:shikimate dehydrogenase